MQQGEASVVVFSEKLACDGWFGYWQTLLEWIVEGTSMFKFLKNVSREMKKVSWPTGKELTKYTITVITTVLFVAVFFAVVDLLISFTLDLF